MLTVKEFADATGRFPNQIYDLINKGNQFRKLICINDPVTGKKRIPESEVENFPFTPADKLRIELKQDILGLDARLTALELRLEDE